MTLVRQFAQLRGHGAPQRAPALDQLNINQFNSALDFITKFERLVCPTFPLARDSRRLKLPNTASQPSRATRARPDAGCGLLVREERDEKPERGARRALSTAP